MFERPVDDTEQKKIKQHTLFMLKSLIAESSAPVKAEDKRNVMLSAVSDFSHSMNEDIAKKIFSLAKKAVEKYGVKYTIKSAECWGDIVRYLSVPINEMNRLQRSLNSVR